MQITDTLNSSHRFDIVIIGGGPAGTTAACLLADKGWSVCLLEKEKHPRFHIGESLLPSNIPIFERLGVLDKIDKIGVKKYAAEFNSTMTSRAKNIYYFVDAVRKNLPVAYEVRRSEFDQILFKNCQSKGVTAWEGMRVDSVALNNNDSGDKIVTAVDSANKRTRYFCRFIIDASGRDTFLASTLNLKRKNPNHRMAAIFGHYRNVTRLPGKDEGNISIYWFKGGWLWMIPLQNNVMSVGAVCWPEHFKTRNNSLEEFLLETIRNIPQATKRMEQAKPESPITATGNYSYTSSKMIDDGYLLIGDAYAFVDPVFSSGVYLAMNSAVLGADLVDCLLRNPSSPNKQEIRRFERNVTDALRKYSWFIYRFNSPAFHKLFMFAPERDRNGLHRRIKSAVISVLAGDINSYWRISAPVLVFKMAYYFFSLSSPWEALNFYRYKAKQNRE